MRLNDQNAEHRRFLEALKASCLSVDDLWMRYFALGGDAGEMEIEAYLSGLMQLTPLQHDILAHAINERLEELAPPRAPYSSDLACDDSA